MTDRPTVRLLGMRSYCPANITHNEAKQIKNILLHNPSPFLSVRVARLPSVSMLVALTLYRPSPLVARSVLLALGSLVCLSGVCLSVRHTRPAMSTVYYVLFFF